jgi:hypothetical protein
VFGDFLGPVFSEIRGGILAMSRFRFPLPFQPRRVFEPGAEGPVAGLTDSTAQPGAEAVDRESCSILRAPPFLPEISMVRGGTEEMIPVDFSEGADCRAINATAM